MDEEIKQYLEEALNYLKKRGAVVQSPTGQLFVIKHPCQALPGQNWEQRRNRHEMIAWKLSILCKADMIVNHVHYY